MTTYTSTSLTADSGLDVETSTECCHDNATTNGHDDTSISVEDVLFYIVLYKWVVPTLFALIICIGLVGNCLVIAVTVVCRRMQTTVNVLLLNLAASDLTFICICIPFMTYHYAADNWLIGEEACKLMQYVLYVTLYVTVYTLVAIAVVRFVRIVCRSCRPLGTGLDHYQTPLSQRSRRRSMVGAAAILISIWVTMLIINWPVLALYGINVVEGPDEPYYYCAIRRQNRSGSVERVDSHDDRGNHSGTESGLSFQNWETGVDGRPKILFVTFFLFTYVIPLAVIASMYLLIARYLHRKRRQSMLLLLHVNSTSGNSSTRAGSRTAVSAASGRNFSSSSSGASMTARGRRTSHAWRLFCAVVIAFAVTWLPLHVHLLVAYFVPKPVTRPYEVFRVLSHCLAYSGSCINPIIYHYVSSDFRRGLHSLLKAAGCRRRQDVDGDRKY